MNLKAFIGVFAVALLVLAVVPSGYAVAENTFYEVMEPYGYNDNLNRQQTLEVQEKTLKALKAKPESELTPEQANWLGHQYEFNPKHPEREDLDKAEHYYKLAVEKDPDYAEGYISLATLYSETKEYKKKLQVLDASLIANPDGMDEEVGEYAYSEMADVLKNMERQGYDVGDLPERFDEIVKSGQYENLKTKQDLRKIGYMKIREEKLKPLMEEGNKPLSVEVSEAVTKDPHQKELVQYFFLPIVAGAVMVVMIFGYIGVKVGKRVFGRGSRR